MTYNSDVPNTFIGENGEVIFVESWELSVKELDDLVKCKRIVELIERKYGTKDIIEMLKNKDFKRSEIMEYIDAKMKIRAYHA